jgi:hypothetical protein
LLSRSRYLIALTAALVALAGIAAGCGGGGGSGEDIDKVLDQTFGRDKKVDSGKLDFNLQAKLEGIAQLSRPVTVKVGGPFEGLEERVKDTGRLPRSDFDVVADAGGQRIQAGFTSTGDKLYVGFQGRDYVVPDAQFERFKRQLQRAQAQADKSEQRDLSTFGIDPRDWLKDAKDEGTEDVGGVSTIHISAGVNVEKLLDDFDRLLDRADQLGLSPQQQQQLPQRIPPAVRKQIVESVKDAKLDVFTGKDDKVLRKLQLDLRFEVPENLQRQAQGLKKGDIELSYQINELNQPQTITPPKSPRPLSELQRQFGSSGFGALGGAGSSGGGQASSGQSRRYLKCVERAHGDQELQRCANLLR